MTQPDPLAAAAVAASAGDPRAFERVIEATSDELYRLSARIVGDLDEASDVLQDAYVRAFAALRRGEYSSKGALKTWLYRITLNVALNARRSRLRGVSSCVGSPRHAARDSPSR